MTKNIALSRPAMSAIAAFLVLSTPAAFAQEAPTVPMTSPVASPPVATPPTVSAPTTSAPTTTAVPTAQAQAPVIRVPLELPPVSAERSAEVPKPKAAAAPVRTARAAPRPRASEPAPAERSVVAPAAAVASTALPAEAAEAPVEAVAAPVAPVVDTAPVATEAVASPAEGSSFPWEIVGGTAALIVVGGAGLAFARRRRAERVVWDFEESPAEAEWVPGTVAMAAGPAPEPEVKPEPVRATTPTFTAAPSGSMGRHEAMAMAGPTPDNPFATLSKRLARARFLDRQERAEYDATLASQQPTQDAPVRKPVSAWEIAQREAPAAPAQQEVRRPEPAGARKDLKPGWMRG